MRVRFQLPDGTNVEKDIPGIPGKSSYQYAKEGGYTGTEEEFKAKMAAESTPFYVEVTASEDGSSWVANKTFEEIEKAYKSGVALYADLLVEGSFLRCPLLSLASEEGFAAAIFSLVMCDGSAIVTLIMPDTVEVQDSSVTPELPTLMLKIGDKIVAYNGTEGKSLVVSSLPNPNALTIGGQSYDGSEEVKVDLPTKVSQLENDSDYAPRSELPKAFYVNFTDNGDETGTADKTYEEMLEALEAGRPIVAGIYDTQGTYVASAQMSDAGGILAATAPGVNETRKAFLYVIVCVNDLISMAKLPLTQDTLPNPNALTINGTSYNGSTAVDFTSAINSMIDAKLNAIPNAEEVAF